MHSIPKGYWVLFTFLAICEFPMNSVVFDILGEAKWLTYLLAAGLGVIIPLSAHYMGIMLRRESPFESLKSALKASFLFVSVFAVLLGLAYLREKFVTGADIASVLGVEMDPRMVTIVFLSINLLIFVVATLASYMVHIDVADEQIRSYHRTLRSLKEVEDVLDDTSGSLNKLKAKCDEVGEHISGLMVTREKILQKNRESAEAHRDTAQWLINVYRTSNTRARKDSQMPKCFKTMPAIDISAFDAPLDEECE
jgi:hypothetical protein